MSNLIDDATAAYNAWRDCNSGSYLETALANDICRDIVPALIHRLQNPPKPLGFTAETVTDLITESDIPDGE